MEKTNYIFIFAKKKKERREKSVKEIIFWEGIFISWLSKAPHVLSQLVHFILFYFLFNHPKKLYLFKERVPLFYTLLVAGQWA